MTKPTYEISITEIETTTVHEQDDPTTLNLTREVKPSEIEEFGHHFLQADPHGDMDDPDIEIKHVDVITVGDSDQLVQVDVGGGWAGILMGKGVTFTVEEIVYDDDEEPIRIAHIDGDELRALPQSRREPRGNGLTTPDTIPGLDNGD